MAVTDTATLDADILGVLRSRLKWWTAGGVGRIIAVDRQVVRDRLTDLAEAGRVSTWQATPYKTVWGRRG